MPAMDISPFYTRGGVGQLDPPWQPTVQTTAGAIVSLIGLNPSVFTLIIHNTKTLVDKVGGGTFVIVNAASGIIQYNWVAGDTSTPGTYTLQIQYQTSIGPKFTDPVPWEIKAV